MPIKIKIPYFMLCPSLSHNRTHAFSTWGVYPWHSFSQESSEHTEKVLHVPQTSIVWLVCKTCHVSFSLGLKPLPCASKSCQDCAWLLYTVQIFTFVPLGSFRLEAELDKLTNALLEGNGSWHTKWRPQQRRESSTMLLITRESCNLHITHPQTSPLVR